MQGRMRGAGLHQVEDISFAFEIPLEDQYLEEPVPPPPPPQEPLPNPTPTPPAAVPGRPTPNTSAKRKQLAGENVAQTASPTTPPLEVPQNVVAATSSGDIGTVDNRTEAVGEHASSSSSRLPSSGLRRVSYAAEVEVRQANENDVQSSRRASVPLSSPAATPRAAFFAEEVGESPADAPGSGRRRPLRLSDTAGALGSSSLLQRVVEELDETIDEPPSSSPAERRKATQKKSESVRSGTSHTSTRPVERRRSPRLGSSVAGSDSVDEGPSPLRAAAESPVLSDHGDVTTEAEAPKGEQGEDLAEEVTEKEAAQRLGRKRPRRSLPSHSPDLGSAPRDQVRPETEPQPEPEPEPEVQPRAKRHRTDRPAASPAIQKQPKTRGPKPKAKSQSKERPLPKKQVTKKKTKAQKKPIQDDDAEAADSGSVPVTVQRFTKNKESAQVESDEDDDSILAAEIPFANRAGVNAVDVLSKLCQELIDALLSRIEERVQAAEDNVTKREQRTMARALEALREELRTRLLEHVCRPPHLSRFSVCWYDGSSCKSFSLVLSYNSVDLTWLTFPIF